jgi:hypothetical protein
MSQPERTPPLDSSVVGRTTTATKIIRAMKTLLGAILVIWGTSLAVPRRNHSF